MDQQDRIHTIAQRVCANPTQVAAATRVAQELLDELAQAELPRTEPSADHTAIVTPQGDVVLMVVSGPNLDSETKSKVWPLLTAALERFGDTLEIVTFGGLGAELSAMSFARQHNLTHREFAQVWAVPQGDGTTVRNRNAVGDYQRTIKQFVENTNVPIVVSFGIDSTSSGRRAKSTYNVLVRAGAWNEAKPYPRPDDPSPVAAQVDDPSPEPEPDVVVPEPEPSADDAIPAVVA